MATVSHVGGGYGSELVSVADDEEAAQGKAATGEEVARHGKERGNSGREVGIGVMRRIIEPRVR